MEVDGRVFIYRLNGPFFSEESFNENTFPTQYQKRNESAIFFGTVLMLSSTNLIN